MKRKVYAIIILILAIILLIIGVFNFWNLIKDVKLEKGIVADYDRRINIWKNAAGNSSHSKLVNMNIDYNISVENAQYNFSSVIFNNKYHDCEKIIDTFTYIYEIKKGYEKETYEDEPYIIPYLVEDSDKAVIVIPGGGYAFKSIDGSTIEGKDIAETLNKNGINAFVLHYRSNPYEYPIPYLDLQRAIKYLRYHSDTYGIDKNKISIIGFSAGGHIVSQYINQIQNLDIYPEDYKLDIIDKEDATITSGAMIYPLINFNNNIPLLFALFNREDIKDIEKRQELLDLVDTVKNFNSANIKQFIAYGNMDTTVGIDEINNYIEEAENKDTELKAVLVDGGQHGFPQECYIEEYINWLKEIY